VAVGISRLYRRAPSFTFSPSNDFGQRTPAHLLHHNTKTASIYSGTFTNSHFDSLFPSLSLSLSLAVFSFPFLVLFIFSSIFWVFFVRRVSQSSEERQVFVFSSLIPSNSFFFFFFLKK
jgi:hypothetical protein